MSVSAARLALVGVGLLVATSAAAAEPQQLGVFGEVLGGYGFQIGSTPFVPTTDGYEHPMTNGYSLGATLGWSVDKHVGLLVDYEYAYGRSRDGEVANAIDLVKGSLSYHTLVAGVRTGCKVGPGRLYGEMAAGVLFPFETELEYDYASTLKPLGIAGTGTKTDEYNLGVGGHGALGYEVPVDGPIYVAPQLKLRAFTTTNNDRSTRYDNFVTDFAAQPPTPTTAKVTYEPHGTPPSTYSVQDIRAQIALGLRF